MGWPPLVIGSDKGRKIQIKMDLVLSGKNWFNSGLNIRKREEGVKNKIMQKLRFHGRPVGEKEAIEPENQWSWATQDIHSKRKKPGS
jgi:hypothetical protein